MSSLGEELAQAFGRELEHLADEIAAYPSDADLWTTTGAQKNAPGTIGIHMAGSLLHFVGACVGRTGYIRDRDLEFSERGVPRAEVARRILACRDAIVPVLSALDDTVLAGPFPGTLPPRFAGMTTRAFLVHSLWHLGWHTGQVYYHRLGLEQAAPAS